MAILRKELVLLITVFLVVYLTASFLVSNGLFQNKPVRSVFKLMNGNMKHDLKVLGNGMKKVENVKGLTGYTNRQIAVFQNNFGPMDDPDLIKFIQQRWLIYPSVKPTAQRYRSAGQEKDFSQMGQSKFVDNLLKYKENGFFIECGAYNGVEMSNSLFFEESRGWTGLLIEPNINWFDNIIKRRKGSYAINVCLSLTNKTATTQFGIQWGYGMVAQSLGALKGSQFEVKVQCFPLYSILKAVGVTTVDFFSLDVEFLEMQVLRTIPWDKVRFDIICIEYRVLPDGNVIDVTATLAKLKELRDFFMAMKVYKEIGRFPAGADAGGVDVIFARKEILDAK